MNFFQKYELIAQDLKVKINTKFFYPQNILPSERKLSNFYQVNRDTIHKAIFLLENENIIENIHKHYYINPYKKDPNISDLLGQNTTNFFINNEELQLTEADKKLSLDLNILLGNRICKFSYIYNQMLRARSLPVSLNYVYIPIDNLSDLNLNLDTISPLSWFREENKAILEKENLQLSLIKPNDNLKTLLKLNANSSIVKRESIFSFKNSTKKIKLISYSNPKYTIITQPVKRIRERVDY